MLGRVVSAEYEARALILKKQWSGGVAWQTSSSHVVKNDIQSGLNEHLSKLNLCLIFLVSKH